MSKGLLDPESVEWRKQNLRRFGPFTPSPGAEPVGTEDAQSTLFAGASGWKNFLAFHLMAVSIVAVLFGLFLLFLIVAG